MKSKFARLQSILLLIVSMSLFLGNQSWAETTTINQEKAKLVGKFAKYVTWPSNAIKAEFVIGVYRDDEKHEYFSNYFKNRVVKGKNISVRMVETINEAKKTNILYISAKEKGFLTLAHFQMNGSNVLMMTEDSNERYKTMVDISYNQQQSKLIFRINDSNIINTPLQVPDISVLLNEKDDELAFNDNSTNSQDASQTLNSTNSQVPVQNEFAIQNQLEQQKNTLSQLNQQLSQNKEQYDLQLAEEAKQLKIAKAQNAKNNKQLKEQKAKLRTLERKLKAQKSQMKADNQAATAGNDQTKEQELAIATLKEQLKKQEEATTNSEIQLATIIKKYENESSSGFQILFFIFLIIAIVALAIAYLMWKKAQNVLSQPQPRIEPVIPVVDKKSLLLPVREAQLIKSENFAALGYIATDITYAVGLALSDLQDGLVNAGDTKNSTTLKPIVTLLENFNTIAADQDDTDVQTFDLIAYMKNMMMLYNFEFEQSDIIYNYSGESQLTIKSVPSYIALILLNLINNSLKHAFDNNGNGIINLEVNKSDDGGATITYSDNGKGMCKDTLEQVFIPFFTTQEERGYVGVGMTTTQELIKNKLSGNIKLESQEGKGTKVILTLP